MEHKICQSCGMPLTDKNMWGTHADGSINKDYCIYCYKGGMFTKNFTMKQMIEYCLQFLVYMNERACWNFPAGQAREQMQRLFPHLKRWNEKDGRSLAEKAAVMLENCAEVTIASVNAEGYPRPVPMSKIRTKGCNEIWMATGADSVKVADFNRDNKAGVSYSLYGDSVGLRGTAEVITDDATRKELWQDWFIHHFPGGPADPNYVLIHFIGTDATYWINGEFAHEEIR